MYVKAYNYNIEINVNGIWVYIGSDGLDDCEYDENIEFICECVEDHTELTDDQRQELIDAVDIWVACKSKAPEDGDPYEEWKERKV